jgi:hypothetical protein
MLEGKNMFLKENFALDAWMEVSVALLSFKRNARLKSIDASRSARVLAKLDELFSKESDANGGVELASRGASGSSGTLRPFLSGKNDGKNGE